MDKFEEKLRNYYQYHCEYQPEAISGEFVRRLKALESVPAAKRPRRRYLLPAAAAIALALGLSGWAWLHFSRPEDTQTPKVTLEEPVSQDANTPAVPAGPATPETKDSTSPKTRTPEQPKPENPASLTKPEPGIAVLPTPSGGSSIQPGQSAPAKPDGTPSAMPEDPTPAEDTAPFKPGNPKPVKPDNPKPINPENTAPVKPDDPKPVRPDDPTPVEPDGPQPQVPDDPNPTKPDDPDPPKPDDPDPPEPDDPDPPVVDPPDVPKIPPEIGVVYLNAGGKETLTLTLLSTGEIEEIDVTGLLPFYPQAPPDPYSGDGPLYPAQQIKFNGVCIAFGWQISYCLTRSTSGSAKAEVTGFSQTDQAEKGENDET